MPAKAGIQLLKSRMDSRLRGNDKVVPDGRLCNARVTFSLRAAHAREVSLLGDFNNWDAAATPMKPDKNGIWKSTLILSSGRYEFKFLVDGKWREASKGESSVPNSFGTLNNVMVIEEKLE